MDNGIARWRPIAYGIASKALMATILMGPILSLGLRRVLTEQASVPALHINQTLLMLAIGTMLVAAAPWQGIKFKPLGERNRWLVWVAWLYGMSLPIGTLLLKNVFSWPRAYDIESAMSLMPWLLTACIAVPAYIFLLRPGCLSLSRDGSEGGAVC